MGNNFPIPEDVAVIGGRKKNTPKRGDSSISFTEENVQVFKENQTNRYEVETKYSPTNYISIEEDKSSLTEIDDRTGKATSKIFGAVKPGPGLMIITPGIIELKFGKGLRIDPDTGKLTAEVEDFVPLPGENVLFSISPEGSTVINVLGEEELIPMSDKVPTSKAIASYTRTITGNINELSDSLKEPGDTTLVDVLNTLHLRDHYTYNQQTPSTTWTINHPLKKKPSVTITSSAGEEMIGDVEYPSLSQVIVRFSAGFSGSAFLN